MKSTGTVVASVCFGALVAFFVYQWWFNPTRAVQRRLSEIAASLSAPDDEPPMARIGRVAQLRKYLAEDVRVHMGTQELASRDQIVGAVGAFTPPPGGWNIQFVDVQVRVNHDTNADADAYMTIEVNSRDPRTGQPTIDAREAAVTMKRIDGEWVVATAETRDTLQK
jgi:SnoaL-like domain